MVGLFGYLWFAFLSVAYFSALILCGSSCVGTSRLVGGGRWSWADRASPESESSFASCLTLPILSRGGAQGGARGQQEPDAARGEKRPVRPEAAARPENSSEARTAARATCARRGAGPSLSRNGKWEAMKMMAAGS